MFSSFLDKGWKPYICIILMKSWNLFLSSFSKSHSNAIYAIGKFFWLVVPFYFFNGTSKVDSSPLGLVIFFTCLYLVVEREHCQDPEGFSFSSKYATELYELGKSLHFLEIEILHLSEEKVERSFCFFYISKILRFQKHLATYHSLYFIFMWC